MSVSRWTMFAVAVVVISSSLAISGCGSESSKPQSIASDERVGQIVEMRKIFDKVRGDWEALTPEDKAEYTRLAGDEAKAQHMWKGMASPPGASQGG